MEMSQKKEMPLQRAASEMASYSVRSYKIKTTNFTMLLYLECHLEKITA